MFVLRFPALRYYWFGFRLGIFPSVRTDSFGCFLPSIHPQVSRNQHDGPVRFIVTAHGTGPKTSSLVEAPHADDPHQHETGTESRTGITEQTLTTPTDPRVLVVSGGEGYRLLDSPRAHGSSYEGLRSIFKSLDVLSVVFFNPYIVGPHKYSNYLKESITKSRSDTTYFGHFCKVDDKNATDEHLAKIICAK